MISVWNVRGMNASAKQRDVAMLVNNKQIGLVGLLETKLTGEKLRFCHQKYLSRFQTLDTSALHPRCRVWLLWDPNQYEMLQSVIEDSYIHASVRCRGLQKEFWITMVYAPNDYASRLLLWDKLVTLKPKDEASLLVGDFNNVLAQNERTRGQLVCANEIDPFRTCLADCGVEDMRSRGWFFTWTNGTILSKIDRALVMIPGWMFSLVLRQALSTSAFQTIPIS